MSDTLYGITHLFFPSNLTQESIYCSTNNFKHLTQSTHLFLPLPRWSFEEIQTFYNN